MKYYNIADLILSINSGSLPLHKEMDCFEIDNPERKSDIHIEYDFSGRSLKYLYNFEKGETWLVSAPLISVFDDADNYYVFYKQPKLVYGYKLSKAGTDTVIYIDPDAVSTVDTRNTEVSDHEPEDTTGEELLLYSVRDAFFFHAAKFGRIAVHSSSIVYDNKVILFSAAAGVGKSTHMRQWKEAGIDHQIFNGDVAMCYLSEDRVYAGGLPWSGTSEEYTSQNLPLGTIFFLRRGETNYVDTLSIADAALSLGARCLTPNWDRALVSRNMDVVENYIEKIQYGNLFCTISPEAAVISREFVEGK